jgi:hypothetical protein
MFKRLCKILYPIGSIANAIVALTTANPVSLSILASQVSAAATSSGISDEKLGRVARIINVVGHNINKAANDRKVNR